MRLIKSDQASFQQRTFNIKAAALGIKQGNDVGEEFSRFVGGSEPPRMALEKAGGHIYRVKVLFFTLQHSF